MAKKKKKKKEIEVQKQILQAEIARLRLLKGEIDKKKKVNIMANIEDKIPNYFTK